MLLNPRSSQPVSQSIIYSPHYLSPYLRMPNPNNHHFEITDRKLALKYHPDRQATPEEKERCGLKFTAISNAYEILGDPERRDAYDRSGTTSSNIDADSDYARAGTSRHRDPFPFFGGADPFQDPFFNRRGRRDHGGDFMDPFDLFQQFFGDQFSQQFHNQDYQPGHRQTGNGSGFQNDGFGMFGGSFGRDLGGFGVGGAIAQHMNMNAMMNNMQSSFPDNLPSQRGFSRSYTSSSSTSFGGNGNGVQESISTSTQIINGKRQTVTERVKVHPDGRVERTTQTSGDDDFPSSTAQLGYGGDGDTRNRQRNYLPSSGDNGRSWRDQY